MKLALGWRKYSKKTLIIVLAIVSVYAVYLFWHSRQNKTLTTSDVPTYAQFSDSRAKQAKQLTKEKKYSAAEQEYLAAAAAAMGDEGPQKAISILEQAKKELGINNATWQLYDALAGAARLANEKQLEIASYQSALQKAEQQNSGATADNIEFYKQQLKSLGAV